MLEADVVMGKLNSTNQTTNIPIMAHPPNVESDLSLENFIEAIIHRGNDTKGIKLDFKSTQAFESSKSVLQNVRERVRIFIYVYV